MISCNSKTENKSPTKTSVSNETIFYLGTYTDGNSEGIYKYAIDKKGILKKINLVAKTNNPSFLCYSPSGKQIIAVNEIDSEQGSGTVESYQIENDKLILISRSSSGGAHPCFVTCNKQGAVLAANYTGGNIGLLNIKRDGQLSKLLDVQTHSGKGTTERQEGPHAHSAWFSNNNKEILSVDLGTNQIWFSSLNETSDKFIPAKQKTLTFQDGAGPRHLAFHPNGKWTYVLNELTGSVSILRKNTEGDFEIHSTVSTLEATFEGFNKSADIHISADGKFLYASNRGPNTIAIFKVDPYTGQIQLIASESTRGNTPRNFSLTPDQKFLVVANQDSNNLVAFKRDEITGLLNFASEVTAPKPVCILF